MKRVCFIFLFFLLPFFCFSQTTLGSTEENYYDFLALQGIIERPYLGYRTIFTTYSNPVNNENEVWNNQFHKKEFTLRKDFSNSGFFSKGIDSTVKFTILDTDFYNSFNTTSPYGFNDESLWQGKGLNSSLTTGFMGQAFGFKFVVKPRINFSQNLPFEYITPSYTEDIYTGKAQDYGDYSLKYVDAPQRFGNKAFASFSLNDTYIDFEFYNFNLGFGNTNIILGPAYLNPLIHSNNAQTYPKIDLGLKKTQLNLFNTNLGYLEFHYWVGKLTESDYFDNDTTNDSRLISAFNLSYQSRLLSGLTLGYSRTMCSAFNNICPYTLFKVFVPFMESTAGYDTSDQRASVYFDYLIPKGGVDLYLEWAKNDYNNGLDNLVRYPFHTQAITGGFKKSLAFKNNLYGELLCEVSYLGSSMDYVFFYDDRGGVGNSFYTHHYIKQGYTNNGQYLGAYLGSGANSQYLEFKLYYPKGSSSFYICRNNPDLNYSYFVDEENPEDEHPKDAKKKRIRANVSFGYNSAIFINKNLTGNLGVVLTDEHNPLNQNSSTNGKSTHRINVTLICGVNYCF